MSESLAYLSLGSNLGNKIANIQSALNSIDYDVGDIFSISKLYENPAIGFTGDVFLNCCISLKTNLSPDDLLVKLLEIESNAGRKRGSDLGYKSRTIDIDILFYDDIIVNCDYLKIPHSKLHERKFVIKPLLDIAKSKVHPISQKSIVKISKKFKDFSDLVEIKSNLNNPFFTVLSKFNNISVEGNIGVGKTSLATKLSQDLNKKLILESFDENPFLKKFYEKPNNYALNLELTFLVDRCKELNDFNNQPDLFKDGIIFDYHIQKSLIFAGVTLNETDFKLYRNIFFLMTKNIIKPDLTIFLIQSEKKLINNIKKRDRVFEQKITSQYLSKINEAYLSAFKASKEKILKIDVSDLDFVQNEMDYKKLIFRIKKNLRQRLKEFPNQYC
ncbi:MAG: 2-amino-4-hydroxy-6-hydroxymethyldihydropteridine diphosphokinase [Flavobacteriales bacterium]|nr:2-amino-4-hydroxy-6-hydroxymethyldihydropteridine diphosphokinase [Flavobacteriales bacterium]|tara:strand:- start:3247 stop:4407 length:1161 start_codon:yes stop_codon:yes gene_type:complete